MSMSYKMNVKGIIEQLKNIDLNSNIKSSRSKVIESKLNSTKNNSTTNDKSLTNLIIGNVIESVFPVYDYNSISFHKYYTDKKNKIYAGKFNDEAFYVENRIDIEQSSINTCLGDKISNDVLLKLVENKFIKDSNLLAWFEEANNRANETRILVGSVGSGKTTFIKHTMCRYCKREENKNNKILFLYFDANAFIYSEISKRQRNKLDKKNGWESWIVKKFFNHCISDILKCLDGDFVSFYSSLKTFNITSQDTFNLFVDELSTYYNNLIKKEPEIALFAIIDYLKNHSSNPGQPIIIIDNLDPFYAYPQVEAFNLLTTISSPTFASIKCLLAIRDDSFLRVHNQQPFQGALLTRNYQLAPVNFKLFCEKRLNLVKDKSHDLSILGVEDTEIKDKINKRLDTELVFKNIGNLDKVILSTLREHLARIVTCILTEETQHFLFGLTNGNLRKAVVLLSNLFYNDVLSEIDYANRFFSKEIDKYKPHEINRLFLTQNKGYMLSNKSQAMRNEFPMNIYKSFECKSHCAHNIICIMFQLIRNNANEECIKSSDVKNIAPICKYYKEDKRKAIKCLCSNLNILLRKNLLMSNGGEESSEEAFRNNRYLFLTDAGKFYIEELSSEMIYLSSSRYDTYIPNNFHLYWENPTQKTPLLWQISSNIQFLIYLLLSEIKIYENAFSKIRKKNSRNRLRRLVNCELSIYKISQKFLDSLENKYYKIFVSKNEFNKDGNRFVIPFFNILIKKFKECLDHVEKIEKDMFDLE